MKQYFKKFTVYSWIALISAVLNIIGIILYIINSRLNYFNNLSAIVIVLLVFATLLEAAIPFVFKENQYTWLCLLVQGASVAMAVSAIMISISSRILSIAVVWGSSLEAGNLEANFAVNQFAVLAAFLITSVILTIVSGFGNYQKQVDAK